MYVCVCRHVSESMGLHAYFMDSLCVLYGYNFVLQIYNSLNDEDGTSSTFDLDAYNASSAVKSTEVTDTHHIFSQTSDVEQVYLASKALSKSCEVLLNITEILLESRVTFFYRTISALSAPPLLPTSVNRPAKSQSNADKLIEQTHLWKRMEIVNSSGMTNSFTRFTTRGELWFRKIFTDFKLMDSSALGPQGLDAMQVFNRHMFALLMERNHELCDNTLTYLRNYYGMMFTIHK